MKSLQDEIDIQKSKVVAAHRHEVEAKAEVEKQVAEMKIEAEKWIVEMKGL